MPNEKEFRSVHGYTQKQNPSVCDLLKRISKPDAKKCAYNIFPIITWLPMYNIKKDLLSDFITGLIIGVMKVSQGLAYAQLAGQHPVLGLYTCLFPPVAYVLFASSKHLSFGSHATTDLMIGSVMEVLVPIPNVTFATNSSLLDNAWNAVYNERLLYACVFTFYTGCILIFIAVFRLGFLARLFSQPLQRGFVFAAVCYLCVSQIKVLLGITVVKHTGSLSFFKDIFEIFKKITELNADERTSVLYTSVVSVTSILMLILIRILNNKYKHKFPLNIPIPGEIVVLICGTLVSQFTSVGEFIKVVGYIPQGLPEPRVPDLSKTGSVIGDTLPVAIVGTAIAISLGNTFADKGKYLLNSTQEIQAIGLSNLFGSFFLCLPAFGAMSRSCVQYESGGKSQFVGCFSSIFIVMILFAGPVLSATPAACLSAMVVVAVANLLLQIHDLKILWPSQKLDCLVWIVTCVGTLLTTLIWGLVIGISAALLSILVKVSYPKSQMLNVITDTSVYREAGLYKKMGPPAEHVVVLSYNAPVSFLNAATLSQDIWKKYEFDLLQQMHTDEDLEGTASNNGATHGDSGGTNSCSSGVDCEITDVLYKKRIHFIVLECSGVCFIDSVGVHQIWKVVINFEKIGVKMLLANCQDNILQSFIALGYSDITKIAFVTVDDAVEYAKTKCSPQPISLQQQ